MDYDKYKKLKQKEKETIKREIIKLYECRKALWDCRLTKYHDRNYRLIMNDEIGKLVGIEGKYIPVIWRTLIDTYARHKRENNLILMGNSTKKLSCWTFFNEMRFFDESRGKKLTIRNDERVILGRNDKKTTTEMKMQALAEDIDDYGNDKSRRMLIKHIEDIVYEHTMANL